MHHEADANATNGLLGNPADKLTGASFNKDNHDSTQLLNLPVLMHSESEGGYAIKDSKNNSVIANNDEKKSIGQMPLKDDHDKRN